MALGLQKITAGGVDPAGRGIVPWERDVVPST